MLSSAQRQVLNLAAKGLKNKQIAERLGIAESTVRNRLSEANRLKGISRPCTLDELDLIAERVWAKYEDKTYYQHDISSKPHLGLAFLQSVL